MRSLAEIIKGNEQLSTRLGMTWASNKCDIHDINRMIVNEKEVCPRCELEKHTEEIQKQTQIETFNVKENILTLKSLVQDNTLWDATFETYLVANEEEHNNKRQALEFAERFKQRQTFNLWFNGNVGVGKSHLSMSILKYLNSSERSCLFMDIDEMLRKLRGSFKDKESKYTEGYFVGLLTSVDYLVLDDLGAETGNIDTDKSASDFTSKILRAVMNGRQDKSTIITTNLSSEKLMNVYDPKLISRMMKNIQAIVFRETKDKRLKNIMF